jgi:Flp pilus assembly protein TadG
MLRRSFWPDTKGAAAVEFAFLAPVMIALFFGTVELSRGLSARGDVVEMASAAADLIAQESATSSDDISNVYSAASTILYPYYDTSKTGTQAPSIRISSIIDNGSTTSGKVAWTCSWTGSGSFTTALTKGGTATIPSGLITAGSGGSVIMAEVLYKYKSPTTQIVSSTGITMSNTFYLRPRRVDQIPGPTTCPAAPS